MDASLFFQVVEQDFSNIPRLRQVCRDWLNLIDSSMYLCKNFTDESLDQMIREKSIKNNLSLFGRCDLLLHGSRLTLKDLSILIRLKKFDQLYYWMKHNPFKKIKMDELNEQKFHRVVSSLICDLNDAEFSVHFVPTLRHFFEINESEKLTMNNDLIKIIKNCCYNFHPNHIFSKTFLSFDAMIRIYQYNLIKFDHLDDIFAFLLKLEKIDKNRTLEFINREPLLAKLTNGRLPSEFDMTELTNCFSKVLLARYWVKNRHIESLISINHRFSDVLRRSLTSCIKYGFIGDISELIDNHDGLIELDLLFYQKLNNDVKSVERLVASKSLIKPSSFDRTLFQFGNIELIQQNAHLFPIPAQCVGDLCHIPIHVHEFLIKHHPQVYQNAKFFNHLEQWRKHETIETKCAEIIKCFLDFGDHSINFLKTFDNDPIIVDFWLNQLVSYIDIDVSITFDFFKKHFHILMNHCCVQQFLSNILLKIQDFEEHCISYLKILKPWLVTLPHYYCMWGSGNNHFQRWETYVKIMHFDGIFHIYKKDQMSKLLLSVIETGNWHKLEQICDPSVIHVECDLIDLLEKIDFFEFQNYDLSLIDVVSKVNKMLNKDLHQK